MTDENAGVDPDDWLKRREQWERFSEAVQSAYEGIYGVGDAEEYEPYVLVSLFGGEDGHTTAIDLLSNMDQCMLPSAAALFKWCVEQSHLKMHKEKASAQFEEDFPNHIVTDARTLGELIEEYGEDPALRMLEQILPQGSEAIFVQSTDVSDVRDLPETPEPNIQKGEN